MKNRKLACLSLMAIFVLLIQLMSPALVYADDETPAPPSDTTLPEGTEAPKDIPATEPSVADAVSGTPELTKSSAADTTTAIDEPVKPNTVEPMEPNIAVETATRSAKDSATEVPTESLPPDPLLNTPVADTVIPSDVVDNGSDAPTPVPVETSSPTPEATKTLEVTSSNPESTETAPAAQTIATEEPILLEVQQVLPDTTSVVVLDQNGQALPLVTQAAADIIVDSDPVWCPTGQAPTPGLYGCTVSYTTLTDLVNSEGATINQSGTIWITAGSPPEPGPVTIDGAVYSSWSNNALTLQGGWCGVDGVVCAVGSSVFTVPITITNWNNSVAISLVDVQNSDLTVSNINGNVNLQYVNAFNGPSPSDGNVTVSNVNSNVDINYVNGPQISISNSTITNGGRISVTNVNANLDIQSVSITNVTSGHGLMIDTSGDISLADVISTGNSNTFGDGAYIDNTRGTGNVTLTGTNDFSNHSSGNSGMFILSNGDVSLSGITSNNNGRGVNISQAMNVTITGGTFNDNCCNYEGTGAYVFADGTVIVSQSTFNRNSLYINTLGDVSVDRVTVDNSSGFGLGVDSFGGNVTINQSSFTNTVADSNNYLYTWGDGADIFAYGGNVTVSQSHFTNNAFDGLFVVDPGDVHIDQSHFNKNQVGGLDVFNANLIDVHGSEFTANAPNYDLIASCYTGIPPDFFRDLSLIFDDSTPPDLPALIDILVDQNCDYSNYARRVGNMDTNSPPRLGSERVNKNRLENNGRNSRNLIYRGKAEFWLTCADQYNFKINLPNGDRVDIYCPVSGKARITRLDNTTLPQEIPTGYTFASAFQVEILQPIIPLTWDPSTDDFERKPVPVIAEGGHITASFVAPPLQPGKTFTILYWDENSSKWIPLKDFLLGRSFQLFSNDPEGRKVISGVLTRFQMVPRRVEVSTNFPGIFVLAQQ